MNISASEHAIHVGEGGARLDLDVAILIEIELTNKGVSVGLVADGVEEPIDRKDTLLVGLVVQDLEPEQDMSD